MTVQELRDKLRAYPGDAVIEVTVVSRQTMHCYIHPVLEVEGNASENVYTTHVAIRVGGPE